MSYSMILTGMWDLHKLLAQVGREAPGCPVTQDWSIVMAYCNFKQDIVSITSTVSSIRMHLFRFDRLSGYARSTNHTSLLASCRNARS